MPTLPISDIIQNLIPNPNHRKVIYYSYALLFVLMGLIEASVFGTISAHNPTFSLPIWFEMTKSALMYLGIPVAGLAIANTPTLEEVQEEVEDLEHEVQEGKK